MTAHPYVALDLEEDLDGLWYPSKLGIQAAKVIVPRDLPFAASGGGAFSYLLEDTYGNSIEITGEVSLTPIKNPMLFSVFPFFRTRISRWGPLVIGPDDSGICYTVSTDGGPLGSTTPLDPFSMPETQGGVNFRGKDSYDLTAIIGVTAHITAVKGIDTRYAEDSMYYPIVVAKATNYIFPDTVVVSGSDILAAILVLLEYNHVCMWFGFTPPLTDTTVPPADITLYYGD